MRRNVFIITVISLIFILIYSDSMTGEYGLICEYKESREIIENINNDNFKNAEIIIDKLLSGRELNDDGISKLHLIYVEISKKIDSLEEIHKWSKASPHSAPLIISGEFYIHKAFQIRGTGTSKYVSDENGKQYKELLSLAYNDLEKAFEINPNDPSSSALLINVCKGLGLDKKIMDSWFNNAIKADSNFYYAYYYKLDYLKPRWQGSPSEYNNFVEYCYNNSNKGSIVYTLILDYIADVVNFQYGFEFGFLKYSSVTEMVDDIVSRWQSQFPNSSLPIIYKARIYRKLKKNNDAIDSLEEIVTKNPNNFEALKELGISCSYINNHSCAIKYLERYSSYNPYDTDVLYLIGYEYGFSTPADYQKSSKYFEAAISLNPSMSIWYGDWAMVAFLAKDYNKCIDLANKCIDAGVNEEKYYTVRSSCYVKASRHREAIDDLTARMNIANSPKDFSDILLIRASIYKEVGNKKLAIDDYEKYLVITPDLDDKGKLSIYDKLSFLYHNENDFDNAIKYYSKKIEINSNDYDFLQRAKLYSMQGKHDKAVSDYQKLVDKNPSNKSYLEKLNKLKEEAKITGSGKPNS